MGTAPQGGLGPPGSSVLSRAWSCDQSEALASIASPNPRRARRLSGSTCYWVGWARLIALHNCPGGWVGFAEGETDLERISGSPAAQQLNGRAGPEYEGL